MWAARQVVACTASGAWAVALGHASSGVVLVVSVVGLWCVLGANHGSSDLRVTDGEQCSCVTRGVDQA